MIDPWTTRHARRAGTRHLSTLALAGASVLLAAVVALRLLRSTARRSLRALRVLPPRYLAWFWRLGLPSRLGVTAAEAAAAVLLTPLLPLPAQPAHPLFQLFLLAIMGLLLVSTLLGAGTRGHHR